MRRRSLALLGILVSGLLLASSQTLLSAATTTPAAVSFVSEQTTTELRAGMLIGQTVINAGNETVGAINDLVFDAQGRIGTVIIGVGGFLGVGQKSVGVPFGSLTFSNDRKGVRMVTLDVTKEALLAAPDFKVTDKTTFEKAKDKASELGSKIVAKAVDLTGQAAKKIEKIGKTEPSQQ